LSPPLLFRQTATGSAYFRPNHRTAAGLANNGNVRYVIVLLFANVSLRLR